ncbi:MAG: hypothetical protein DMF81_12595, partial [Acidobacteria bacterium]
MKVVVTGAAGF